MSGNESDLQTPLTEQIGGRHYKQLPIQPVQYIHANGIGYFEGNVIKYVSRWRDKGGLEDLEKAKHYLALLIEFETNLMSVSELTYGRTAEVQCETEAGTAEAQPHSERP